MNILLPWPSRDLHPNSRVHWSRRAKAAKVARYTAYALTKAEMRGGAFTMSDKTLRILLTFNPPNSRRHDLDGCLSANKAHLDGIADALGVDDSKFALSLERGPVKRGGAVHVRVGE